MRPRGVEKQMVLPGGESVFGHFLRKFFEEQVEAFLTRLDVLAGTAFETFRPSVVLLPC